MELHARAHTLLRTPSWTTLDPKVATRGRALVLQQLAVPGNHNNHRLRAMLAWFDRPEITSICAAPRSDA